MEGYCPTGQSPQRAAVPMEEEEEEEDDDFPSKYGSQKNINE
jgi:hypothetical protein